MKAALALIHDHLHHGEINSAHEACELALAGDFVSAPSLTVDSAERIHTFAIAFNGLARTAKVCAVAITAVPTRNPSAPGQASLQLCGNVDLCREVERLIRGESSLYMGDHGQGGAGLIVATSNEGAGQ